MCVYVGIISMSFNDKYILDICVGGYSLGICTHTSSSEGCRFIPKTIPISPEMAAENIPISSCRPSRSMMLC